MELNEDEETIYNLFDDENESSININQIKSIEMKTKSNSIKQGKIKTKFNKEKNYINIMSNNLKQTNNENGNSVNINIIVPLKTEVMNNTSSTPLNNNINNNSNSNNNNPFKNPNTKPKFKNANDIYNELKEDIDKKNHNNIMVNNETNNNNNKKFNKNKTENFSSKLNKNNDLNNFGNNKIIKKIEKINIRKKSNDNYENINGALISGNQGTNKTKNINISVKIEHKGNKNTKTNKEYRSKNIQNESYNINEIYSNARKIENIKREESNNIETINRPKYDVIEIPVNDKSKIKSKPILRTKTPIEGKLNNRLSLKLKNKDESLEYLLGNIHQIIARSKNKIANDLNKIIDTSYNKINKVNINLMSEDDLNKNNNNKNQTYLITSPPNLKRVSNRSKNKNKRNTLRFKVNSQQKEHNLKKIKSQNFTVVNDEINNNLRTINDNNKITINSYINTNTKIENKDKKKKNLEKKESQIKYDKFINKGIEENYNFITEKKNSNDKYINKEFINTEKNQNKIEDNNLKGKKNSGFNRKNILEQDLNNFAINKKKNNNSNEKNKTDKNMDNENVNNENKEIKGIISYEDIKRKIKDEIGKKKMKAINDEKKIKEVKEKLNMQENKKKEIEGLDMNKILSKDEIKEEQNERDFVGQNKKEEKDENKYIDKNLFEEKKIKYEEGEDYEEDIIDFDLTDNNGNENEEENTEMKEIEKTDNNSYIHNGNEFSDETKNNNEFNINRNENQKNLNNFKTENKNINKKLKNDINLEIKNNQNEINKDLEDDLNKKDKKINLKEIEGQLEEEEENENNFYSKYDEYYSEKPILLKKLNKKQVTNEIDLNKINYKFDENKFHLKKNSEKIPPKRGEIDLTYNNYYNQTIINKRMKIEKILREREKEKELERREKELEEREKEFEEREKERKEQEKREEKEKEKREWEKQKELEHKIIQEEYEMEKNELKNKNNQLLEKISFLLKEVENSKNVINIKNEALKKYVNNYDKMEKENNYIKSKIVNLEGELNIKKNEMNEKTNKINELRNINGDLETEMNKLKKIYNEESNLNKETRQNYDLIKNNYTEIKNQYDLLNIKYQTLSDENFNYKRDKLLYEKELETKNQMIQNLLENNNSSVKKKKFPKKIKNNKKEEYYNQINYTSNNIEEQRLNGEIEIDVNEVIYIKNDKENLVENNLKENDNKNGGENGLTLTKNSKKEEKYNKYKGLDDEELRKIRDKLLVERNDTTNLYNKIPLKIHKIEQIKKREELEKKLAQINSDLVQIRLRLKGNI